MFPPALRYLIATAAVVAIHLAWWAQYAPRLTGKPCPWIGASAIGGPLLLAHLMLNRFDFAFPPAAGVGWLVPLTAVWTFLMILSLGRWHSSPHPGLQLVPEGISLVLAALAFWICQAQLPWLYSPEESGGQRYLLGAAVVAGGLLLSAGTGRLAALLPAWGFWLGLLALTVPLALVAGLGKGPAEVCDALWIVPGVCAGSLPGCVLGRSATAVPVPAGQWVGVAVGLPFLWFCVSRTPAAPVQLPVLMALAPAGVGIFLGALSRRLHPAALALMAAALLLLAGSAVLHTAAGSLPPPGLLLQEGDDSGAYD